MANKFHNASRANNDSIVVNAPDDNDSSDEQKAEYALFFRNCIAKKQKKEIKEKLKASAQYRKSLMIYFESDFEHICNFYFAMPELVNMNDQNHCTNSNKSYFAQILFDFGSMFDTVDQRALENCWPNIVRKLRTEFNVDIQTNIVPIMDTDLMNLLALIKYFIPVRSSIKVASEALFTFSKVISI